MILSFYPETVSLTLVVFESLDLCLTKVSQEVFACPKSTEAAQEPRPSSSETVKSAKGPER